MKLRLHDGWFFKFKNLKCKSKGRNQNLKIQKFKFKNISEISEIQNLNSNPDDVA